jgi:ketosteroid isomerase-like protein
MSEENVEAVKRAVEAGNRRDVEAFLAELDPEVEWHPALLASVAGRAAVYRGYEGVREFFRDLDEAFVQIQVEFDEIRDLGDRIVAIGHLSMRGKASGAATESPLGYVIDFKNGRVIGARTYLDVEQTLEAAGLRA